MQVDIEIGTREQRALITAELAPLVSALEGQLSSLRIERILIPTDFDATVNCLQGTTSYKSVKDTGISGVVAVAKIIREGGSTYIVLSPRLYSDENDNQIRSFIIFHELMHVLNNQTLKLPREATSARDINLQNLYSLYDEYLADHGAYGLVDALYPEKSKRWSGLVQDQTSEFLEVANDPRYRDALDEAVESYRDHRDMDRFLNQIRPTIQVLAVTITHLFSNLHYRGLSADAVVGGNSSYINESTVDLMEQFRLAADMGMAKIDQYEHKLERFFMNFGIHYRDTPAGIFCQIIENG